MNKIYYSNISQLNFDTDFSDFSDVRKKYIQRITDKKRKIQSIAVWKLLQIAIVRNYGNINIEFSYDNGRFFVKNNKLYFSLAHSKDIVVVCVSEKPCGIDVELVSDKILKIDKKILNNLSTYTNLNKEEKVHCLTKIWTESEAKYKSGCNDIVYSDFLIDDNNRYYLSVSSEICEFFIEKIELK